ncbi:MAG: hypothetical protein ABFS34_09535 [Gemmatimonadota bacterium]
MNVDRAARWAEVLANFGVIVTLVVLIIQVQDNTRSLRGQAILDRAAVFTEPFISSESLLPTTLAKLTAVDGAESVVAAYMDRYDLTYEEGAAWTRHKLATWTSLEAEYAVLGPSTGLRERIRILFPFPNERIWLTGGGLDWLSTAEFRDYVLDVYAEWESDHPTQE